MDKLKQAVAEFKKEYIMRAVKANNGNVVLTAKKLGVHRNTLLIVINKYKLQNDIKNIVAESKSKGLRINIKGSVRSPNYNRLKKAVHRFEKAYLKRVFRITKGHVSKTAEYLGTHRNTIINKTNQLGLRKHLNNVLWDKRKKNKALLRYHTVIKQRRIQETV